ncbi:hypothetical protein AUP68_16844 [Ilyonectria robusta]
MWKLTSKNCYILALHSYGSFWIKNNPRLNSHAADEEDSVLRESTVLYAENCSRIYSSSNLRRPASLMFRTYRRQALTSVNQGDFAFTSLDPQPAGNNFEDMLYEPSLTYESLHMIGRVRIKWVDTLTAHLSFDRATRELSVYCYPSFCVAKILSEENVEILQSITGKLLPPQFGDSSQEPASVYRETLLTYRLLFGQSHKSRKILTGILEKVSLNETGANMSQNGGSATADEIDRFLKTLCTTPLHTRRRFLGLHLGKKSGPHIRGDLFPISALSLDHELIESNSYSARDDFPVFGQRLLALQRFNKRHQPSKMTDLWRDRRNPLQWYTFWAVLIVGGFGMLLGLLQLTVGFVQMAYAIHPAD